MSGHILFAVFFGVFFICDVAATWALTRSAYDDGVRAGKVLGRASVLYPDIMSDIGQ